MFDESLCFSNYWPAWRIVPALTLGEAAYLLSDDDPMKARSGRVPSSITEALRTALELSVRTGDLAPFELWVFDGYGNLESLDPTHPTHGCTVADHTTVRASDLAIWADANEIAHFWGGSARRASAPPRDIHHYPAELRAAIEAFEAVTKNPQATAGRSPRQALLDWIADNKPELGSNARERIATVANWQPAGGAPKTPGG